MILSISKIFARKTKSIARKNWHPFSIKNDWVDDVHHLLDIQHLDLVIYPIHRSSKFNNKSITSYSSCKAYTFFASVFFFVILVKLLLSEVILGKNCIRLSDAAFNNLFIQKFNLPKANQRFKSEVLFFSFFREKVRPFIYLADPAFSF